MWRNSPLRRSAIDACFMALDHVQPYDPDLNIYCMFVTHAQWAHYSEIKYSVFIYAQGAHHFRNKSIVYCVFVPHAQSWHYSELKRLFSFCRENNGWWNFSYDPDMFFKSIYYSQDLLSPFLVDSIFIRLEGKGSSGMQLATGGS